VIDDDPELQRHAKLRSELEDRFRDSIEWLFEA
jgi:hypothetical protein